MKRLINIKKFLGVAVMLSVTAGMATALSFEDIVAGIDSSAAMQAAVLEVSEAEYRYAQAGHPGDATVTLTPSMDSISAEGGSWGEQIDLVASITASIPVGLSKERKLSFEESRVEMERARESLDQSRTEIGAGMYQLYQAAWLAQLELSVLNAELESAQESVRVARELFNRGETTIFALNSAEDDLATAETAVIEGNLAKRITWLELAYAADIDVTADQELLEPISMVLKEIPAPPELTAWADSHAPVLVQLEDEMEAVLRDMNEREGILSQPSVRATFSGFDHSASASFNFANPGVSLSYSVPITTIGDEIASSGSGNGDTWQVGISLSIPFQSGTGESIEESLLQQRIRQLETQMNLAHDTVALRIRTGYQQYLMAAESITQATQAVETAQDALDTVLGRRENQRATLVEELEARAQLERAIYRLHTAEADREKAKILTAQAASWLTELFGEEI